MWKCPKCERTFRNIDQSHFCGRAPETIDQYIEEQAEDIKPILNHVRSVICEVLSDVVEKISWGMPTWWKATNIFHNCYKKHSCPRREAMFFNIKINLGEKVDCIH